VKKAKSSNRQNLSLHEPPVSKTKKSINTNKNSDKNNRFNDTSLHSTSLIDTISDKSTIKSNILKELDISFKQDEMNVTYVEVKIFSKLISYFILRILC
jgi:hypothetical protein